MPSWPPHIDSEFLQTAFALLLMAWSLEKAIRAQGRERWGFVWLTLAADCFAAAPVVLIYREAIYGATFRAIGVVLLLAATYMFLTDFKPPAANPPWTEPKEPRQPPDK